MMIMKKTAAVFGTLLVSIAVADGTSDEMGPAGFLWPPDREWSDKHDNTAPCGSDARVDERTVFPLSNGKLALVAQDNVRAVHISVSYEDDPQEMDDFETFFGPQDVGTLDLGHTCITVPNPPSNIQAGDNATFSILYVSNFEDNEEDRTTHYACTDVTFVELASFDETIPCFNATMDDPEPEIDDSVDVTTKDKDGNDPHNASDFTSNDDQKEDSNEDSESDSGSSSSGIGAGAIAGAVVGSVAGLAIIAAGALWLFRRKSQGNKAQEQNQQGNGPMRQVDAEKAHSDTLSTRS